jgi:hypothetical protein
MTMNGFYHVGRTQGNGNDSACRIALPAYPAMNEYPRS